jgi:hypothetical protein
MAEAEESRGDAPVENPRSELPPPFYPYVNEQGFLTFAAPRKGTPEGAALTADIIDLDHRIHRRLGVNSSDWKEVMGVLENAANVLGYGRLADARELYMRANIIWLAHLEEKNRLRYLTGVAIGFIPAAAVSAIAVTTVSALAPRTAPAHTLALVCLFAAFGSATSVLTRLSSIPLAKEMSNPTLIVSGASRPSVAVLFALTVHLAIVANLVSIHVGSAATGASDAAAAAVAFAVGFSERFAKDIIVRISGGSPAAS